MFIVVDKSNFAIVAANAVALRSIGKCIRYAHPFSSTYKSKVKYTFLFLFSLCFKIVKSFPKPVILLNKCYIAIRIATFCHLVLPHFLPHIWYWFCHLFATCFYTIYNLILCQRILIYTQ